MAYEAINQEDKQKVQQGFGTQGTQNTNTTTQAENTPVLGGQQSTDITQGVTGANTQQVTGGQTAGGQKSSGMGARLSSLKKYIESNRGSGMAQKIQSGIEDIRTGVQKGIGESESKFKGQIEGEQKRLSKGEQLIKASNEQGGGVFEKGRSEAFTQDKTTYSPEELRQQYTNDQINRTRYQEETGVNLNPITTYQTGSDVGTHVANPEKDSLELGYQNWLKTQTQQTTQPDFSDYGQTAADRLAAFSKYRTGEVGQYDIENEGDIKYKAAELQKLTNLGQSEEGRYQLLKQSFKRPSYTTGQQKLDQLMLQADPTESSTLANMTKVINDPVQQQLIDLQAQKETQNAKILSKANKLKSDIAKQIYGEAGVPVYDTAGALTDIGTGVLGQFQQDLANRKTQTLTDAATRRDQIAKDIAANQLSNTDYLKDLGITQDEFNRLQAKQGLLGGMSQFLTTRNINPDDVNVSQIATDADFKRQAALEALANLNTNYISESAKDGLNTDLVDLNFAKAQALAAQKRDAEIQKMNDYYEGTGIRYWKDYAALNDFSNRWNTGLLNEDIQNGFDYKYAREHASGAGNSIFDYWKNWRKSKEAQELTNKYKI